VRRIPSKRKKVTSNRPRECAEAPHALRLGCGVPRTSGRLSVGVRPRYTAVA
jgi:hypothetical protein